MPKHNKVIERVFSEITTGDIQKFLDFEKNTGLHETENQTAIKKLYTNILGQNIESIKELASIEEIIIQMRCVEFIKSNLRLSLSRDYIYARSLFYRRGREMNDIRVIIGKTDEYGDKINELIDDPNFRTICTEKLVEGMNKEIINNIKLVKSINLVTV
jgi:hypothetical protein